MATKKTDNKCIKKSKLSTSIKKISIACILLICAIFSIKFIITEIKTINMANTQNFNTGSVEESTVPIIMIERKNYNTFIWNVSSNTTITGYQINQSTNPPTSRMDIRWKLNTRRVYNIIRWYMVCMGNR